MKYPPWGEGMREPSPGQVYLKTNTFFSNLGMNKKIFVIKKYSFFIHTNSRLIPNTNVFMTIPESFITLNVTGFSSKSQNEIKPKSKAK